MKKRQSSCEGSEEKLKELYYQAGKGFLTRDKFWKRVKEEEINASYSEVLNF